MKTVAEMALGVGPGFLDGLKEQEQAEPYPNDAEHVRFTRPRSVAA